MEIGRKHPRVRSDPRVVLCEWHPSDFDSAGGVLREHFH